LHRHELPSIPSNKDVAVCDACQQGISLSINLICRYFCSISKAC
jgi:hypothetical protein